MKGYEQSTFSQDVFPPNDEVSNAIKVLIMAHSANKALNTAHNHINSNTGHISQKDLALYISSSLRY